MPVAAHTATDQSTWTPISEDFNPTDDTYSKGGNFYLTKDVSLAGTGFWFIPSGYTLNLCLNGSILNLNEKAFIVDGTLNLYDCNTTSRTIDVNGEVVTITGGAITGGKGFEESPSTYGGAVFIREGAGTFTMNGGNLINNTAKMGGGVYNRGTFTLNGGDIANNTASSISGGGVYNGGTFTMNGGNIMHNTAPQYGGGVYNDGTFTMTGGNITKNKAQFVGGVYVAQYGTLSISGTAKITDNYRVQSGISEPDNVFLLSGKTITILTDHSLDLSQKINVTVLGLSTVKIVTCAPTNAEQKLVSDNSSKTIFRKGTDIWLGNLNDVVEITWNISDTVYATTSGKKNEMLNTVQPADPTKANHKFIGWNETEDATEAIDTSTITLTEDKTYYAVFKQLYSITVEPTPTHGTITPSATKATAGEQVTLTIHLNNGYQLKAGTLKANDGAVPITDNKFTMPAANVKITAEFEPIPQPPADDKTSGSQGMSVWLTETPTPTPTQNETTPTPTDTVPTEIPTVQPTENPKDDEIPLAGIIIGIVILLAAVGIGVGIYLKKRN